ncbi:1-propanol dehydrogenase PduQ [uncultured Clostridium sp.]|uniref:1-propanol dehydrogenase PduQ n=1 Tax=uncultured Clostridium sp. TaxID=59620 RepID=UPI0025FCFD44|nr:1-propanol dehydrogenase PduQ [uncultured Clostridium sp.]
MGNFKIGTEVHFGDDSLKRLNDFKDEKVFVVTDPFMVKSGTINRVTDELKKVNSRYMVYSDIVPDPSTDIVAKGVEAMMQFDADVIVALGGGSAIDSAKTIKYFFAKIKKEDKKMRFIAIPTTSGTGSEVTGFSVITDKKNNVKSTLIDNELLPDEAILDANFVKTVPNFVTADTGMDVLTHAIEAYVSVNANDFTDAFAEKVVKLVFDNLLKAYRNGDDLEARKKMHNASCMAGMAFNNAALGLNHGMAHTIGAKYHISHGRSNAIILPYVIEYNADIREFNSEHMETAQRYAYLAGIIGVPSASVRQAVRNLIESIKDLLRDLNIPDSLKQLGVPEKEFNDNLDELAKTAIADRTTGTNPRKPQVEDVKKLFKDIYS